MIIGELNRQIANLEQSLVKNEKSEDMTRYLGELKIGQTPSQRTVLDGVNPPEPKN